VALVLLFQGWRLVARRCRTPWGELDLVLERGSEILIVEVKTRRREPAGPVLGRQQHRRILRAARMFCLARGWNRRTVRMRLCVLLWRLPFPRWRWMDIPPLA